MKNPIHNLIIFVLTAMAFCIGTVVFGQTTNRNVNGAEACNCDLFVPNVFTPNSDGMNDVFDVSITDGTLVEGTIYNRYGELLYRWWGNGHWDGRTQAGMVAPAGTYLYVLNIQTEQQPVDLKGTVTLLR